MSLSCVCIASSSYDDVFGSEYHFSKVNVEKTDPRELRAGIYAVIVDFFPTINFLDDDVDKLKCVQTLSGINLGKKFEHSEPLTLREYNKFKEWKTNYEERPEQIEQMLIELELAKKAAQVLPQEYASELRPIHHTFTVVDFAKVRSKSL